ncbi:putative sucrose-phosphate synthase 4 [Acorus gramineus]|uniref:Sucrose-phosphate synthase n=1 Tax=Acorus gramineus TaxID=55184 RepID=A0AAV9BD99_ACOGR|nr:putative sucrose-phosphate synthase 4 [Acorus gramineus]
MAMGNEWINGYLEAILDVGGKSSSTTNNKGISRGGAVEELFRGNGETTGETRLKFSPTKYFVEEVVSGFDEKELHRTWIKVIATRNTKERSNRLENMCWRIWHLARKKKQIKRDDAHRLAKRRLELEQGRNDAADDLSDLSEGEKEKIELSRNELELNKNGSIKDKMPRINSDLQVWNEDDGKRLYIVLVSLHGLVRGDNMELGRDADTGGQVKYVVELARALANIRGVHRVDLLTRQICSPEVDWSYGEPVEMLTRPSDVDSTAGDDACGAYIIRLPCGPRERYIPKELLWLHIPEFVDRALSHIVDVAKSLGDPSDGGKPLLPYVIHGHYADAGEVAAHLSGALNVPMVLTGHSLGRNKFEQLLKQGRLSKEDINATYKIMRRIEGEEFGLDAAEMVVTSTRQEIEEQWGLYDGFDLKLERKLRARRRRGVTCLGRYMSRMTVIPPGMDFSYVTSQNTLDNEGDLKALFGSDRAQNTRKPIPPIWSEITRFFTNPHKPIILALSRPDPKKNVTTLLKAFGESRQLRELANLTLILGNRDDIEEMSGGASSVLTTVLMLIDRYDLYGQVAIPKHHKQSDVPEIYRLAAKTKGVFINPALVEPFGLTLIEAAAYGLPVVATKNGGPMDIIKALNNGVLVDPHDQAAISAALLKLVADKSLWLDCRRSGLRNIHRFSWPEHCRSYLSHVEKRARDRRHHRLEIPTPLAASDEPMTESLRDVEDLSIRISMDGSDLNSDISTVVVNALKRRPGNVDRPFRVSDGGPITGHPGRRQRIFVISVDCYKSNGRIDVDRLSTTVDSIAKAGGSDGRTGLVFSTGSTVREAIEALESCHVSPQYFDALICGSGSDVCYPWRDLDADVEYAAHVEYKWPGEHVQAAAIRLCSPSRDDVAADEDASGSQRWAYSVREGSTVRKVDDVKQRLRMRGFRCGVVYVRRCTRLNVTPLFASRTQALRYLSIRWGVDLSRVTVFVGDRGDTDHEELLLGLHKTVILEGSAEGGSERLVGCEEAYKREDVVPLENPNVVNVKEGYGHQDILAALETVGMH